MSWQGYVDNNIVGTGKFQSATILGLDGSTWATSPKFSVPTAEALKIVNAFKNPNDIIANGLYVAGTKYFALRYDDRSLYGKKGASGVVCVKTVKAVLIGIYDDKTQPGEANSIVEKLADYLIGVGY